MAVSTIKEPQVKKKTVPLTTNSVGRVSGSTQDLFGVEKAIILGVYFVRDSYSLSRKVTTFMYGTSGYTLEFTDNDNPVINKSVTAIITYIN